MPIFHVEPFTREKHNGLHVVRIGVDVQLSPYMEKSDLFPGLLDHLTTFGFQLGKRFRFVKINLSDTAASMRIIFNGNCNGRPIHRETEVEVLNLSNTKTSVKGLQNLCRLTSLQELYLDNSSTAIDFGSEVFNKSGSLLSLRLLSVVGSSLSSKWLSEVQTVFPNLLHIYFTRKKGSKAIGWQDVILMQTMRQPVLLPCGHIADKSSVGQFRACSFDRKEFKFDDLLNLEPKISYLCKVDGKWFVHVVDYLRKLLDSKTYYHSWCGNFFNFSSIHHFFPQVTGTNLEEFLKTQICVACNGSWSDLRVCHPHMVETNDYNFHHLGEVGAYSVNLSGLPNRY
eukprot:TRINITY_DN4689_c0_g2_i13.p1 TRINITY_DN4689_c0_g2~~TRINITY_DN4689_c0_g2_i13.p1  ORF type:complete len:341 (-),score=42.79 TRINITY_DN4689_c0_g2_i13:93-1115(-)